MGAIIRLTLGFFLSLLLHGAAFFLLIWLGKETLRNIHHAEPETLTLDLRLFAPPQPGPKPAAPRHATTHPTPNRPAAKIPAPAEPKSRTSPKPATPATDPTPPAPVEPTDIPAAIPTQPVDTPKPKLSRTKQLTSKPKPRSEPKPEPKPRSDTQHDTRPSEPSSPAAAATAPSTPAKTTVPSAQSRTHHPLIDRIRAITNRTLRRMPPPRLRTRRHGRSTIVVAFHLMPDGALHDLHLQRRSRLRALNRHVLRTVRKAAHRYPHPTDPVDVRLRLPFRY